MSVSNKAGRSLIAGDLTGGSRATEAERVKREYESSAEYRIGCLMMDSLTEGLGLDADTVEAMLSSEARPDGAELLSSAAAGKLLRMEREGKLKKEAAEYLGDADFVKLLERMPAEAAVELYEAVNKTGRQDGGDERAAGMQYALEQLAARRALPAQTRAAKTASAAPDFDRMSTEEFNDFKRRRFGHR